MTGLKDKLKRATNSVASAAVNVVNKANQVAKTTMTSLTDLNDDGKIDAEDLKIALEKAKSVGGNIMDGAGKIAKEAVDHPVVKDAAAGAMVGGAIGLVIPLIPGTTAVGAGIGAAVSVIKGRGRTVVEITNKESSNGGVVKKTARRTTVKKTTAKLDGTQSAEKPKVARQRKSTVDKPSKS